MSKKLRNPRLQVVFTQQQYDLIRRLAELQDTSASKVVSQFVEHVEPMLRDVVRALEAAAEAKGKPAAKLLAAMADLSSTVQGMTQHAVDQGDMFAGQVERVRKRLRKPPVKAKKRAKG